MRAWGSPAGVIAALRDDAAAEIERLEREADTALARLRASIQTSPDEDRRAIRLGAVRRMVADRDAEEDWQDTVTIASDRDAWIAAAVAEGRHAIATAPDVVAWTARLAEEAIRQLPGAACVLVVPAAVLPRLQPAMHAHLEGVTARTIALESGAFGAGCVARTVDGRVAFDNRLEAREQRTIAQWRTALAHAYETAIAEAAEPETV